MDIVSNQKGHKCWDWGQTSRNSRPSIDLSVVCTWSTRPAAMAQTSKKRKLPRVHSWGASLKQAPEKNGTMVQQLPCLLLTTMNAFLLKTDVAVKLRIKADFPSEMILPSTNFHLRKSGTRRFQAWKPTKEHALQNFRAIRRRVAILKIQTGIWETFNFQSLIYFRKTHQKSLGNLKSPGRRRLPIVWKSDGSDGAAMALSINQLQAALQEKPLGSPDGERKFTRSV